jgi:hypothetical protein
MQRVLLSLLVLFLCEPAPTSQQRFATRDFLIERAKSLELDTPYVPPPGDPLEHHAAGFAKIMCSAVAPSAVRPRLGKPIVDRGARAVHVDLPNGTRRTAKFLGSQGCVTLPIGQDSPAFTPITVKSRLPDAATHGRWEMCCRRTGRRPGSTRPA